MAKKKFAITPIQPLEIEFPDGEVVKAIFTIEAFLLMSEEFGDLTILAEEEKEKPFDLATKLLYSGMKVMDNSATYEEAQAIVIGGGLPLIEVIFENVLETFDGVELSNEEIKKKVEQMALQYGLK